MPFPVHMSRAALCALLAAQLVLSPIFVSFAWSAGISPDPNAPGHKRPAVDAASNGVPLVNITPANGSGLSHNQYHDFNVNKQGAILNNSHTAVNTQLGGIVAGNPNFGGNAGAEARTILNEVTSANRSRIEGYIEVGGRAADVILANPNGITVNGGGFINVPRATLSTGTPQINAAGALTGHEVRQGHISIEGAGINADNTSAVSLLARTAKIEAEVRANHLALAAGRNRVNADGTVTPLAEAAGPPPEVSIDSSALGGMYANRIKIVATEKGVGVNLEGYIQSADQMEITADGRLVLRGAASGGDAALASNTEIQVQKSASAGKNLRVTAPAVSTGGTLAAGENLSVQADSVRLQSGAQLASGVDASGKLSKKGKTQLTARQVQAQGSRILSGGTLNVAAQTAAITDSTLAAGGDMALSAAAVDLAGSTVQGQRVTLAAQQARLHKSRVQGSTDVRVQAALADLEDSSLSAAADLWLTLGTATLDKRSSLSAGNDLIIEATDMTLNGSFAAAGQDLAYRGATLSSVGAALYAARDQHLRTSGLLLNDGGDIYAGRDISIAGAYGSTANTVRNLSGSLSAGRDLSIAARTVENKKREFVLAPRARHTYSSTWYECNKEMLGHGCDRRQLWHYVNTYEDVILKDSPSARLLAGHDILIGADLLENHYSAIAAGDNLAVQARKVDNAEAVQQRTTTHKTTLKGWDSDDDFTGEFDWAYSETSTELSRVPAVLSANSTLYLNAAETFNNYSQRQNTALPTGTGISAGFPLAGSPMFRPVASPGHNYLIETNPLLTQMGYFYGSNYFLSRIGLDQKRQQAMLLGDAFFETRLVQQQILERTGRRFLNSYSTDADQMRGLMDAAVAQKQGLNLATGIALSAEQVAALTEDIIWLVEEEHMGQKVLVPRVYLAAATRKDLVADNSVQARTVTIVAGAGIFNEGRISGESVHLTSVNILNNGGLLRGKTLNLTALKDIVNSSGTLRADTMRLQAGRDILSQTLSTTSPAGNTYLQARAGMEAGNSLTAAAGADVTLLGSSVQAGKDVSLHAGRNLTMGTVTEELHFSGGPRLRVDSVTHTGSGIAAGGTVRIAAGNDLTVAGSHIAAGGDAHLAAGGNIAVKAVEDSFSSFVKTSSGNGGLLSTKSSRSFARDVRTSKGSGIVAGGDVSLAAGAGPSSRASTVPQADRAGHLLVQGSTLGAVNDLTLTAKGDIVALSGVNTHMESRSKSSSTLLSSSSKRSGSINLTHVATNLLGKTVTLDAGGSVALVGSNILAGADANLTARDGHVQILSAQNVSKSWSFSKKTGFGLGGGGDFISAYGSIAKAAASQASHAKASTVLAGNNLNIAANRDAAVLGSVLQAGNDLTINAGRQVNILPGQNTAHSSFDKRVTGFGVGAILTLEKHDFFAGAQVTAKGSTNHSLSHQEAVLNAGHDLSVAAGQDINLLAGKFFAGHDLSLHAGQSINVLQADTFQEVNSYSALLRAGVSLVATQSLTPNVVAAYQNAAQLLQSKTLLDGLLNTKGVVDAGVNILGSSASASLTGGVAGKNAYTGAWSKEALTAKMLAHNDLRLKAGQDILLEGATLAAGKDLTLAAQRNLHVVAATSAGNSDAIATNYDVGAGVAVNADAKGGYSIGFTGKAALGMGASDGSATGKENAQIVAGGKLSTSSGADTNLLGANMLGDTVDMSVGNNLTLASVKERAKHFSYDWSVAGQVTIGYGASVKLGENGDAKGAVNYGTSRGTSDIVSRQTSVSGLHGVRITTQNTTDIQGAAVSAANNNLLLDTGALRYGDIQGRIKESSFKIGLEAKYDWGQPKKTVGPRDEKPEYRPQWLEDVMIKTDAANARWTQVKKDMVVAPGAFGYANKEVEQLVRAAVGAGSIVIRNNPGQDYSTLLRDTSQAEVWDTVHDTDIQLKPLFNYVDTALAIPGEVDGYIHFVRKPDEVLIKAWKDTVEGIKNLLPKSWFAKKTP